MITTEKKKRGRKPKILKEDNIENLNNTIQDNNNNNNNIIIEVESVKIPKKRGRKPKGGKIIENTKPTIFSQNIKQNIILHLKCTSNDLTCDINKTNLDTYIFNDSKYNNLSFQYIKTYNNLLNNTNINNNTSDNTSENTDNNDDSCDNLNNNENNKEIYKKLQELTYQLHTNNVPDKKSACFWCTYDFDNPSIFIPKYEINNSYFVYGCFCSLECACAHLMEENIDQATKFERYTLLNYIYGKLYNYEKNIKPAPNPYYTLDKYYGNLSIQEYRKILKSERLLLVVDKPLCRQLPELHEDNDDFLLNNKIGSGNSRYKIKKSQNILNKTSIMQEQFNLT